MLVELLEQGRKVLEKSPLGIDRVVRLNSHKNHASLSGGFSKISLLERVPAPEDYTAESLLIRMPDKLNVRHIRTIPANKLRFSRRLDGETGRQDSVVEEPHDQTTLRSCLPTVTVSSNGLPTSSG